MNRINANARRFGILRLVLLPLCLCGLLAVTQDEELFELVKVKDGIYAAIAKPQYKLNCNAAVIINEDDVLIVDSHSKPSAAKALLKQIGKITQNPVRYVVNTHFHYDHARGNQAFFSGFPHEVTLISSEQTRKDLIGIEMSRLKKEVADLPGNHRQVGAGSRQRIRWQEEAGTSGDAHQARAYQQELKSVRACASGIDVRPVDDSAQEEPRDHAVVFGPRPHRWRHRGVPSPGEGAGHRRLGYGLGAGNERWVSQ